MDVMNARLITTPIRHPEETLTEAGRRLKQAIEAEPPGSRRRLLMTDLRKVVLAIRDQPFRNKLSEEEKELFGFVGYKIPQ